MKTRHIGLVVMGLALALLAPRGALAAEGRGGGGGGGGGPCAGFGGGAELVLRDNCFDAVSHSAEPGTTLLVRNDGDLPHTFTAVDGSFDTGVLQSGQSAEIRLGAAGILPAYCTLHGSPAGGGMAGALVVGQPGAATAGAGPLQLGAVGLAGVVLGGGAALALANRRRAAPATAPPRLPETARAETGD